MTSKRDTWNYTLRDGHKVVYHGITDNVDRRIREHEESGKIFTSVSYSVARTRGSARQHEIDALQTYKANHNGKLPKYNERI